MAIGEFLRNHPGIPFCPACLALNTDMSLEEARLAVARLGSDRGFIVREAGSCSRCARQRLTSAQWGPAPAPITCSVCGEQTLSPQRSGPNVTCGTCRLRTKRRR